MRTTINLPEALADEAKVRAARDGRTFTSLVVEGLRMVLDELADDREDAPRLPTSGDPNGRFLIDILDRDALWEVLDADGPR